MGLEPVPRGQNRGLVAPWWQVVRTPWDHGWGSAGFLRPAGLRQLSPFAGRKRWRDQPRRSIPVIAGGFYEPVMGSESSQMSVLLSQFGDLLMGEGRVLGARSSDLAAGRLLRCGWRCPVSHQPRQAERAWTSGRPSAARWGRGQWPWPGLGKGGSHSTFFFSGSWWLCRKALNFGLVGMEQFLAPGTFVSSPRPPGADSTLRRGGLELWHGSPDSRPPAGGVQGSVQTGMPACTWQAPNI